MHSLEKLQEQLNYDFKAFPEKQITHFGAIFPKIGWTDRTDFIGHFRYASNMCPKRQEHSDQQ